MGWWVREMQGQGNVLLRWERFVGIKSQRIWEAEEPKGPEARFPRRRRG